MDAFVIVALIVMGMAALTLAWQLSVRSRRLERKQDKAMLRSRLVAISTRQRQHYYND